MKRPPTLETNPLLYRLHYNNGEKSICFKSFSSIVSFLLSLARDCPKQRNGERDQDKIAVALFLNS
jgi:hypothetical protein